MKIACLFFSASGKKIAEKIRNDLGDPVDCFTQDNYKKNLDRIFADYDGIIFISATGIAVRISVPYLKNKRQDPAIVVVDDMANFTISLVSGHIGGANELTNRIASLLENQAVITTASDNRGFEAVDLFAERLGLKIEDETQAKIITAMMVDGRKISFHSELVKPIKYPNLVDKHSDGCIVVDIRKILGYEQPFCVLRPKILHVGIGCRRGTYKDKIISAINKVFEENNLSTNCIQSLATIDLKKDEVGIIEAGQQLQCQVTFYSSDQISSISHLFQNSDFVKETIGVGSVCEPCAFLAGGELIVGKTVFNGITIAVGKSDMGIIQ